jgi:hypothetical protein
MNDDEYGTLLLRPLVAEPAGAPRVEVPRAMRDGRRLRRVRWWSSIAAPAGYGLSNRSDPARAVRSFIWRCR